MFFKYLFLVAGVSTVLTTETWAAEYESEQVVKGGGTYGVFCSDNFGPWICIYEVYDKEGNLRQSWNQVFHGDCGKPQKFSQFQVLCHNGSIAEIKCKNGAIESSKCDGTSSSST